MKPLVAIYAEGRAERDFDAGIERAIEAMLSSPKFLIRVEKEPNGLQPGATYKLSDLELASRLSFFLWRSIPDDELLRVADRKQLTDATVLMQQVKRMLADERSRRFLKDFSEQWLETRNISNQQPALTFQFDPTLRDAMAKETELFFQSQVREDRPIPELLKANYTYLNQRLAEHYGVRDVLGSHFRRVTLTNEDRFGLLGQASILTVTSYNDRTSVVRRGYWVLDTLLGAPPPPPPPNVPPLKENTPGQKPKALRERMEQHRNNAICANYHHVEDPVQAKKIEETMQYPGEIRVTVVRETRASAAGTAGILWAKPELAPALHPLLNDREDLVARAAANALGILKNPISKAPLLAAFEARGPVVQERAAAALGELRSTNAVPALVALLRHPNKWHRQTAVRMLGERRDTGVIPTLRKLLTDEDGVGALHALWALHQTSSLAESDALTGLKHPAPVVRAWTARLLGDVRGRRMIDLCAAPGGKTAQLAAAGGHVTAVDRSTGRMARLGANLQRLGLQVLDEAEDRANGTDRDADVHQHLAADAAQAVEVDVGQVGDFDVALCVGKEDAI